MRTRADIETIAKKNGWIVNPNEKVVTTVINGQNKNKDKLGEYYCPCKMNHVASNICPCENAQNEIDVKGHCHCNLYYKA
jgi:ferredoxin-thioredoxin reductase catalytic chain